MKQSLLSILLVFVFGLATAQAQTITGRVTDASNQEGIPGASVLIKGTTTGTVTDVDGKYTITAGSGSVLVFQLLGYKPQEITVGSQTTVDVSLETDASTLNEIVVIGYGTQEKREITGSIVGVKAEDIKNIPAPSFESALQGRTTGVQITSGSGKVGQGFNIRVRGSSSLSASNQPLYVVDGIMITASSVNSNDEPVNPLADINVNDIESIDVLKDASAAAIYGARASNGVVVITTKRGKAGKTNINVGYSTGFGEPTRKRGFLNRAEYLELFREAGRNSGFTEEEIDEEFDGNILSSWRDPSIEYNWEDYAFQRSGFQQLDINATGGNEKTQFYVGGSYTDQGGIIVGNKFNRLSARISLDNKITDKLTVGGNLMIARSKNFRAAADNQFNNQLQLVAMPPTQRPYLDNGRPNMGTLYYNALAELTDARNTAISYRNLTTLYGAYKIIPELSFRSELGVDLLYLEEETYNGRTTSGNTGAPEGIGTYTTSLISNYTFTNTLNYNKTFNSVHTIDGLLGMSYQESNSRFSSIDGRNFPTDDLQKIASGAVIAGGSSSGTDFNFLSYFARANY
ncbi:MAG: SusC/RagA family TonB-linked outer membrane protein, partial [Bacteroidetes bacterium]